MTPGPRRRRAARGLRGAAAALAVSFLAAGVGQAGAAGLALPEFKARVLEVYASLDDAFAELDASPTDLDAALDEEPIGKQEFRAATALFKRPLTKQEADSVFGMLDTDRDGIITKTEFLNGCDPPPTTTTYTVTVTATTTSTTKTTNTVTSTTTPTATTTTRTHTPGSTTTGTTTTTATATATTTTTSSTSTTPHEMAAGADRGEITAEEFKRCLFGKHASPAQAFGSMGSNPADVHAFARLTRGFHPPLTDAQARVAFEGLDADRDYLLFASEFVSGMQAGSFAPAERDGWRGAEADDDDHARPPLGRGHLAGDEPGLAAAAPTAELAFLLLAAYAARSLCLALRLPGAIGALLAGALGARLGLFGPSTHGDDAPQELTFFLAVLVAGFEFGLPDFSARSLALAGVPFAFELVATWSFAAHTLGLSFLDALALAATLSSAGSGTVAARMTELGPSLPGSALPRLAATSPALESALAFALLGAIASATPGARSLADLGGAWAAAATARWVLSAACGAALGVVAARLLSLRRRPALPLRRCFTGTPAETLLLALCVALMGLGVSSIGSSRLPLELSPWPADMSLLQAEPLLLVFGMALAAAAQPQDLSSATDALAGLWLVAQLAIFASAGAALGVAVPSGRPSLVLPMLLVGIVARVVGAAAAAGFVSGSCPCAQCAAAAAASSRASAAFWALASPQRGLVQGCVLGLAPAARRLLRGAEDHRALLLYASALSLLLVAPTAALAFELLGPRLAAAVAASAPEPCDAATAEERRRSQVGWTVHARAARHVGSGTVRLGLVSEDDVVFEDATAPSFPAKDAARALARVVSADPDALLAALNEPSSPSSVAGASMLAPYDGSTSPPRSVVLRRMARPPRQPVLEQFEAAGDLDAASETRRLYTSIVRF